MRRLVRRGQGNGSYRLKKKFMGKQVLLDYSTEPNRDRIAGPGPNDPLNFVKKIGLLR